MLVRIIAWTLAAIFPTTGSLPGLDQVDCRDKLAEIMATAPHGFTLGVYAATAVFLLSPLLTIFWPAPAPLLSRGALDRHANAMANHRLYLMRQAMLLLKTVGGMVWGAHEDVRGALALAPLAPDPGTWRRGEGPARGER